MRSPTEEIIANFKDLKSQGKHQQAHAYLEITSMLLSSLTKSFEREWNETTAKAAGVL